jgi:hypothetical protein
MSEDDAKLEILRLCGRMHTVCMALKVHAANDTAVIVDERMDGEGTFRGAIQFEICAMSGHAPPSAVRKLFGEFDAHWITWKGMTLVDAVHRSKTDSKLVYEAEFLWKDL